MMVMRSSLPFGSLCCLHNLHSLGCCKWHLCPNVRFQRSKLIICTCRYLTVSVLSLVVLKACNAKTQERDAPCHPFFFYSCFFFSTSPPRPVNQETELASLPRSVSWLLFLLFLSPFTSPWHGFWAALREKMSAFFIYPFLLWTANNGAFCLLVKTFLNIFFFALPGKFNWLYHLNLFWYSEFFIVLLCTHNMKRCVVWWHITWICFWCCEFSLSSVSATWKDVLVDGGVTLYSFKPKCLT